MLFITHYISLNVDHCFYQPQQGLFCGLPFYLFYSKYSRKFNVIPRIAILGICVFSLLPTHITHPCKWIGSNSSLSSNFFFVRISYMNTPPSIRLKSHKHPPLSQGSCCLPFEAAFLTFPSLLIQKSSFLFIHLQRGLISNMFSHWAVASYMDFHLQWCTQINKFSAFCSGSFPIRLITIPRWLI